MGNIYVWDEYTLIQLREEVEEATDLDSLKTAIRHILNELPTEWVN